MKQRILCIDGSALSHCHMMWRIKTGGSDISDGSGQSALSVDRITGTQRIAVILDQPQIVTVTEIFTAFRSKGLPGMCKHHCFCFFLKLPVQKIGINIILRDCHIHKHQYCSRLLDHQGYGCRKSCCHRDHFISRKNLSLL